MTSRFRVLAGPSSSSLQPLEVNTDSTTEFFEIKTPLFEGRIVGNIKGFVDENGDRVPSKYFDREDRKKEGTTWSIQVQGRFLTTISANDVMFGNTFDRPLKLPWGTSAAMQFASYIDPVLEHDLNAKKPWALSPLISTMPNFKATHQPASSPLPDFNPLLGFPEDVATLIPGTSTPPSPIKTASKRRKYFEKEERRKAVKYTPDTVVQMDFCYGYFQFPELYLAIPGGITFDLKKYWDKQPVRFTCCKRHPSGTGPGEEIFVVQFEVTEGEEESEGSSSEEQVGRPASGKVSPSNDID